MYYMTGGNRGDRGGEGTILVRRGDFIPPSISVSSVRTADWIRQNTASCQQTMAECSVIERSY